MPITRVQAQNIANGTISTAKVDSGFTATYATYAAVAANLTPRITTVNVANSTYAVLDDTAVNTAGGYLVITGANFQSGALVTIGDTAATSTTYVNDTTLRSQVPAKTAGSYAVYVQNPDGGTAIRVLGVTYSNTPIWGTAATLSNQAANTSFNVSISATSDSSVTYSNTTALPAGTQLLSNGYFYGTVTIGAETTYTFDVKANDAENQDASRTFSLTVTVTPLYSLYWTGSGFGGKSGFNNTINYSSPVQLGTNDWSLAAGGSYAVAAVKANGTLWTWGYNPNGQLGLNDLIHRSSPVQVGASTNWLKSGLGYFGGYGIKTDGTLWMWGRNDWGQLGISAETPRSSPTQVGTSTNWSKVSTGSQGQHTVALKTDGTIWAWGKAIYGQLGFNTNPASSDKSSPTQIGTSTDWSDITQYSNGTIALKTNGTLWSWGRNEYGETGTNQFNVNLSSPTQIGTDTTWSKVYATAYDIHAIKTNGTLWYWGQNKHGVGGINLGVGGSAETRSSPTQVGSDTNWSKFGLSLLSGYARYTGAAFKTDNSLWVWGKNDAGALGQNDATNRSSPVQLGSTGAWADYAHSTYGFYLFKT